MPADEGGHKFIPGVKSFMGRLGSSSSNNDDTADAGGGRRSFAFEMAIFCRSFSKCIEVLFDLFLVVITLVSFLTAAISLERGSRFDFGDGHAEYYTIGTFYSTYSHTYPICVDQDPASMIRASLAMQFFTLLCLVLCFQVSLSSLRKELQLREKARRDAVAGVGVHGTLTDIDAHYRAELEMDERLGRHSLVPLSSDSSHHGTTPGGSISSGVGIRAVAAAGGNGGGGESGGAVGPFRVEDVDEESGVVEVTL